jgi:hypothetical protein
MTKEEQLKKEEEEAEKAKTPPVNPPFPFVMRPFPYAFVGAGKGAPKKEEVGIPVID